MTKPIYEPKGKAKEYGDYAINIYTGCPHRCFYCFAPNVLRKDREKFHTEVKPREGIVEATRRQIEKEGITGKLIHLCFTCDPYPTGYDSTATREIIRILKETGNHVQILTKGDGRRDIDLLDKNDWYGITYDGKTATNDQIFAYHMARDAGIRTWISFEPVLDAEKILTMISEIGRSGGADKIKIGKLNYHPSEINWKEFGQKVEQLCQMYGIDYYIKDSLRKEMED